MPIKGCIKKLQGLVDTDAVVQSKEQQNAKSKK